MKKKITASLLCLVLLGAACAVPVLALPKVSTAVDCLSSESTLVKAGVYGNDVSFSAADFEKALGVKSVKYVTFSTLPDPKDGVLWLSNLRISEGQTVKASNLELLRFSPASEITTEASFTFLCDDYGGGAPLRCDIRMAESLGHAPVAVADGDASLSVYTQKSISVFGKMKATDEDGDPLEFLICSYPKNGTLTVLDKTTGEFRYTPSAGYTGKDKFTYVARDQYGNYSKTATVNIAVDKASTVALADMENHSAALAATILTANGIMSRESNGGVPVFLPDKKISRADFTVMAMKIAGVAPLSLSATSFEDNADIDAGAMPYVATAQARGYIHGSLGKDGLVFRPNDAVTRAEAAIILCNIFRIENGDSVMTFSPEAAVPVWARPALSALSAADIMEVGTGEQATAPLTRGDAAEILYKLSVYNKH